MSEVTLFKNTHGCVHVALASGRTVAFTEGKFFTTDRRLEDELMWCAEHGEHGIYVDVNESQIDPQFATPMDQLKKRLREELLAELKAGGQLIDAGTSVQPENALQLSMATTQNVPGGVGDSDAVANALKAAQIADMNKPTNPELTPAQQVLEKMKTGKNA